MKTKVLFFCPDFYPRNTGYSNAFLNIIKSLVSVVDYEVDVLTDVSLGSNTELNLEGVNVIRVNKKSTLKLFRFFANQYDIAKKIKILDKDNDYDLIFVETFEYSLLSVFSSKDVLRKLAIRIHACYETERRFFFPGVLNFINRKSIQYLVVNRLNNFVSTNSYHINFCKEHFFQNNLYKICKKNFFVIPNTIDEIPSVIEPSSSTDSNRKIKMLTLGRMDHSGRLQKGFSDLLNALYLCKNNIEDQFDYTNIRRGEYLEKYKAFIK